ncbi:MAG: PAS domain-containing protein [Pyrinomonadaceae bacterium]|nr:PAS domain-containing protein [Pyrinomonadaceae bacterium]
MVPLKENFKHTESRVLSEFESSSLTELKFISELGRNLLFAVHPKKVAAQVAETLREGLEVDLCAVAVELDHIGLVSCAFDRAGEKTSKIFHKKRFREWLNFLPLKVSFWAEDEEEFFFHKGAHKFEYVFPLHIYGEVKGAVIVGINQREDFPEISERLVEAATQMTAMSLNLSAHYEATMSSSINQAKEEHQKFTENVLDALPVSLYVIDRHYRIVMWNQHREIGSQGEARDSVVGRNVFEVLNNNPTDGLRAEFEKAFETGKIQRIEQQTTDENGRIRHWVVSKIPMRDEMDHITHIITIGEDVTPRVEAIHAAGRAEKLAAVGRLAAGVVHEINNPLATISACAESLESRLGEGAFDDSAEVDDLGEYLGLIRNEAFRCKTITNGLLEFSRGRNGVRYSIDVKEVIESTAKLLEHQKRGNNVTLNLEIEENLPLVVADEGQIQQAIIALSTNGIDAMPDGGTLKFKAFREKKQVVIEIEDSGIGINTENMSKIFEPFFTTKEVGKGTGLGLAVCYGIITDHEGRLAVRSKVGIGTTFTIYLPAEEKI